MIWKVNPGLDALNNFNKNTLVSNLGIEFTEIGEDYIIARMPVDQRTFQPLGLLHGGASVVLSESIGSMASWMILGDPKKSVVGIEVNANHLKSVKEGFVYGRTKPIKVGKKLHIWQTEIFDDNTDLICISRLTVMVLSM